MKRILALMLLAATPTLLAGELVKIDLSGPWRGTLGDRPEFAATNFDDHAWRAVRVPASWFDEFPFHSKYWLRRRVALPADADRTRLVLAVGTIQSVYEIYVNGQKIGGSGDFESFAEARIPRPRTFVISPSIIGGRELQIAVRVQSILRTPPVWHLPDRDPGCSATRFWPRLPKAAFSLSKTGSPIFPGCSSPSFSSSSA